MTDPVVPGVPRFVPTAQFLEVAQGVAHALGLDTQSLVEGTPVRHEGLTFWLHHHGQLDAAGMVLVIEIAPLAPQSEAQITKALLRHAYITPAGATGYYALHPDRDVIVYCYRIDFDKSSNSTGAVLGFIEKTLSISRELTAAAKEIIEQGEHHANR